MNKLRTRGERNEGGKLEGVSEQSVWKGTERWREGGKDYRREEGKEAGRQRRQAGRQRGTEGVRQDGWGE